MTIKSGAGVAQYGAELTDNWWGEWLIYVRSYGGDFMNEDETDITLDSDGGYIPKRRIRLFTGDSAEVKVQAQGLDAGDVITVTASMNGYGPVASWKLNVTAGQEA